MWNVFKQLTIAVAMLAVTATMCPALASPTAVEKFDQHSWQQFQTVLPRPSAVVFTTTDCTHCPLVIKKLSAEIRQRHAAAKLIVVVMDGDGNPALLRDPHYQHAHRLFEFSGQTPALQYSVNPSWRGITPYVALFPRSGAPRMGLGAPTSTAIDQWLSATAKNDPFHQ